MNLQRLEVLIGTQGLEKLSNAKIAVIGIGGVGGFCVEALARCGIGNITICDGDAVEGSNINRQLVATSKTIGMNKAKIMKKRLLDINPNVNVNEYCEFWHMETDFILGNEYDYVVDAIDIMKDKLDLIEMCKTNNIKIVSAMGAGCRMNSSDFVIDDVFKTYNDPFAKKVRYELKKRNISSLDVVFSKENPQKVKDIKGSAVFAVGASGLLLAEWVVKEIIKQ